MQEEFVSREVVYLLEQESSGKNKILSYFLSTQEFDKIGHYVDQILGFHVDLCILLCLSFLLFS
jgi:hypothetical protein